MSTLPGRLGLSVGRAIPVTLDIMLPVLVSSPRLTNGVFVGCLVSRWDRLLIFGACNLGALVCFVICFAMWPYLIAKPRKFVIL
jgi:hypothetical protein